jgi:hypothetical protein
MTLREREPLYFYELHEGDDEVFTDLLLAHESEYDEQEFLAFVVEARGAVIERFEEDSLSEAIAAELERRFGFLHIDDSLLRVAVTVSAEEGETRVATVDERRAAADAEDDGFRSLLVDLEPEEERWQDR